MRKEIEIDEWEKILKEDCEKAKKRLEDTILSYANYVANVDVDHAEDLFVNNFSTLKDDTATYKKVKAKLEFIELLKELS